MQTIAINEKRINIDVAVRLCARQPQIAAHADVFKPCLRQAGLSQWHPFTKCWAGI